MRIIAGVDGGGTKTKLICKSLEGNDEHVFGYGPFNINAIGEAQFRTLLSRNLRPFADNLHGLSPRLSCAYFLAGKFHGFR